MIRHVYEGTVSCPLLDLTIVATCDLEIADYVRSIGGRAVMTSDQHVRATDRCAEAIKIVEEEDGVRFDIAVMVQGDEPMTKPEMITAAVQPLLEDPEKYQAFVSKIPMGRWGELEEIGGGDLLHGRDICVVEWAERADELLPADSFRVHIDCLAEDARRLTVMGPRDLLRED